MPNLYDSVAAVVTVFGPSAAQQVFAGGGRVVYVSGLELSGTAAATFALYDGNPAAGRLLPADFGLAPSESARDQFPTHGLPYLGDLWVGAITGSCRVTVMAVPEDVWHVWAASQHALAQPDELAALGLPEPLSPASVPAWGGRGVDAS